MWIPRKDGFTVLSGGCHPPLHFGFQTQFEQALAAFDGTVLAVVHDRYFIEGFASEGWRVEGDEVVRGWV